MQYYALDGESIVQAIQAVRQKNYLCPECRSHVRLRKGPERQPHFYHLSAPSFLQSKQQEFDASYDPMDLAGSFASRRSRHGEDLLLYRTDCRRRLGKAKNCLSKSSARPSRPKRPYKGARLIKASVTNRSGSYTINAIIKRRSSLAESYLRKNRCYYTDIDEKGHGKIYDQWDIAKGGRRIFRGPPLPVDLTKPLLLQKSAPEELALRFLNSHLYFQGDFCDRYLKAPPSPREIKHALYFTYPNTSQSL